MIKRLLLKQSLLLKKLKYYNYNTFFTKNNLIMSGFNKHRIEIDGSNDIITIHPAEGKHSATIILMHGLGDTSSGWRDVGEEIVIRYPYVKVILPTAKERPVTLNMGAHMPAWYDITGLTADRAAEDCIGIDESVTIIKNLMETEASLGIKYERMMLAGFSQGGAMTLFTGLQLSVEQKLAGLLVMSGYLPAASKFKLTSGLDDIPILHCHGDSDVVVRHDWAVKTKETIVAYGVKNYELKTYNRLGHGINQELQEYAFHFISKCLVDDPSLALKAKEFSEMSVKELKIAIRNYGLGSQAMGFSEKQEFVKLLEEHKLKNS